MGAHLCKIANSIEWNAFRMIDYYYGANSMQKGQQQNHIFSRVCIRSLEVRVFIHKITFVFVVFGNWWWNTTKTKHFSIKLCVRIRIRTATMYSLSPNWNRNLKLDRIQNSSIANRAHSNPFHVTNKENSLQQNDKAIINFALCSNETENWQITFWDVVAFYPVINV